MNRKGGDSDFLSSFKGHMINYRFARAGKHFVNFKCGNINSHGVDIWLFIIKHCVWYNDKILCTFCWGHIKWNECWFEIDSSWKVMAVFITAGWQNAANSFYLQRYIEISVVHTQTHCMQRQWHWKRCARVIIIMLRISNRSITPIAVFLYCMLSSRLDYTWRWLCHFHIAFCWSSGVSIILFFFSTLQPPSIIRWVKFIDIFHAVFLDCVRCYAS